jgi:hypothetical protein
MAKIAEALDFLCLMPRGHLKTSLLAVAWVIQQVLKNINIRIAILSHGQEKALEILEEIKSHLQNPELIRLYSDDRSEEELAEEKEKYGEIRHLPWDILYDNPAKDSPMWRTDRIILKRSKIVQGCTIRVNGITGSITGQHYEIIVFDDLHDPENITHEAISKIKSRFRNCKAVLEPPEKGFGWRIVIGTRWKKGDFYDGLLQAGWKEKSLIRSATINRFTLENCRLEDPEAIPIFPEKGFTILYLKALKSSNEMGSAFYSSQFENDPIEIELAIPPELIRYSDDPGEMKKIFILHDPAIARHRRNDEQVTIVIGIPKIDGPAHVFKSIGTKLRITAIVSMIFDEYHYWRSRNIEDIFVGIEIAGYQEALKQWIEEEQPRRGLFFVVTELKPGGRSKTSRFQKTHPIFDNHGIEFSGTGCETLVEQILNYGSMTKDDHADVFSYYADVSYSGTFDIIDPMKALYPDDPNSLEAIIAARMLGGEDGGKTWLDY